MKSHQKEKEKMVKYFAVLLLLISTPSFAVNPCDTSNSDYIPIADRYETGLLFEVKKCGQPTSYVFGTMHSDAPELRPLLEPVKKAILKVKSANFEIKSGPEQTAAALKSMFYSANSTVTLKEKLGLHLYRDLQEFMAKERPDIPEISFQRMKPWAIAVLLQYPKKTGDGVHIDLYLENYAKANNVEVFGLENASEQLKFFDELSDKDSVEFLQETLDSFEDSKEVTKQLNEAYKERDLIKMTELADIAFAEMKNADFQKKFQDDLIKKRNKTMLKRALPRIEQGALIAVGSLHLPWEDGLLKLLENEGYQLYVAD